MVDMVQNTNHICHGTSCRSSIQFFVSSLQPGQSDMNPVMQIQFLHKQMYIGQWFCYGWTQNPVQGVASCSTVVACWTAGRQVE